MPTKRSMRHRSEDSPRLDISALVRSGIFPDLKRGTLGQEVRGDLFRREGESYRAYTAVAGESYRGTIGHITLRLRFDYWESFGAEQRINVVWNNDPIIGPRARFLCPTCGGRCQLLFICY